VVVHHVQKYAQPQSVRGIYQGHQVLRAAIRRVGRVKGGAVVAPAALPVKGGERHHLNGRHAQLFQVRQLLGGGAVGAFRGKGAHMHLVEHAVGEFDAVPVGVCPVEGAEVHHFRFAVHAVGQKAGVGVGGWHAVEHEKVAGAGADRQFQFVDAAAERGHDVLGAVHAHGHRAGGGGPQAKAGARAAGQGRGAQTGARVVLGLKRSGGGRGHRLGLGHTVLGRRGCRPERALP